MEVDLAVYEQSHFRGGAATEIGVNLTGRIQELCTDRGIEYSIIHTASLKKWACGHGKADKAQMVNRAAAYLGRAPIDDNEADAVLIGMMACEEYEA
jgi:Holliday junction resolvasome RuvABC endonuclease subunit